MTPGPVLVVRVGRAGDMVMITPALRAILAKHPQAEVHLLTSPEGRHVLQGFDARLTRTFTYDRRGLGSFLNRRRLRQEIARSAYSHVYCFETNRSYRALLEGLPGQHAFLDCVTLPVAFPQRCLALVAPVSPQPPWLPLSDAGRMAAAAMLSAAGIRDGDFVVGFRPARSTTGKPGLRAREARRRRIWPLASFARLALLLADHATRAGVKLRIICDLPPDERHMGLELVERSHGLVTLFTERPDFERYKGTMARMNLLVTPDTDSIQIAAALRVRLVALLSERAASDCALYTDPACYVALTAEDTERPRRGLQALSADAVFAAARRFLPVMAAGEAVAAATSAG